MTRTTVLASAMAGVLVAGGAGGYLLWHQHAGSSQQDSQARAAATTLATSWHDRHLERASYVGTSASAAAANFATTTKSLGPGPITVAVGPVSRTGRTAKADLQVSWTLRDGTPFRWTDPVNLVKSGERWGVQVGDRSLWHPGLRPGDAFAVSRSSADRGEIRGAGGSTIMGNQPVHDVLIDPAQATPASVRTLEGVVGSPAGSLVAKLAKAKAKGSQATIPVITYRAADYESRKSGLEGLVGVIVNERNQPLARTKTFGQPLLGSVGPVTADQVKADPKRYRAGGYAGTSGLQSLYDKTLAPTNALVVSVKGDPATVLNGAKVAAGTSITTTLDPRVQTAAEQTLQATGTTPSALVAVSVRTGDVLAVANSPSYGIDRALTGRYQPGSTLKVATTYALLTKGFDPQQTVACPPSIVVDGRRLGNFEDETLSNPSFVTDFAKSCNTAFVKASERLGDDDLHRSALSLGIGQDWSRTLGAGRVVSGSVPVNNGATDKAAASFGQARTIVSPLSVAVLAGSVARGSYIPPALVTSPAPGGDRAPQPLDAKAIQQLHTMMRLVVTDGTGTVLQGTPGGDVYAKTGTAEFDGDGGKVRAWLTGWQGDVAFAVLVEEVPHGHSGGDTAAPVAKNFLTALHASS